MNWLLWLLIGLIVGWLVAFLWDYFFWQRKCEESESAANSKVLDLQASISSLNADLGSAKSMRTSLESKVAELQGEIGGADAGLGLLTGAGGLLGLLGGALRSGTDEEVKAAIGKIDAELVAKTDLETQVGALNSKLDATNLELSSFQSKAGDRDAQLEAKISLEREVAGLRARLDSATTEISGLQSKHVELEASSGGFGSRVGLFAGTSGALGALGMALNSDNDADVKAKLGELNAELAAKASLEREIADLRARLDSATTEISGLDDVDRVHGGSARKGRDRLQEISGLGPNFEYKLFEAGIHTYHNVANATEEELRAAVETDGVESGANYGDWITQANAIIGTTSIAGAGDKLDADDHEVDAKASTTERDRLPDINGIGAVFARRLNAAGIYTFAQMTETNPDRLREIVKAREWQHVDTEDWIEQAKGLAS